MNPAIFTNALSLTGPIGGRDRAPARSDRVVLRRRQRSRVRVRDILRDSLGPGRADDRSSHAGGAEREAKCDSRPRPRPRDA